MSSETRDWVAIAVLGRARGIRGELIAIPLTSHPERFEQLHEVYLFGDGSRFEVESVWFHDGKPILKFRGIDTRTEAERWTGSEVRIPLSERLKLEPGEYFHSEIIGCEVIEMATKESLGRVADLVEGGGGGLLQLEDGTLIPFAHTFCVEIDVAAQRIVVDLPPGLKELNRP